MGLDGSELSSVQESQRGIGLWTMVVGAAPLLHETLEFCMTVDVLLLELYGITEPMGPQTVNISEFTLLNGGWDRIVKTQVEWRQGLIILMSMVMES